jgi:tetratricopeptide (TPR) repeat protein
VLRTLGPEDLERALGMFHEAVGLDPEFGAAHAALARCYVLHAQGSGGDEHYQLAERSLRRALELDPTDLEARLQGVHVDLHHGNKERAKATITALRRERPNDPTVLLTAAMLYRLDGLYDRAAAEYDHLLALNPGDAVLVSYNKARLAMNQGDNDRAVAELEAGRSAEAEHPLLKMFLAIARFQQGRINEAQSLTILESMPWLWLPQGVAIAVTVLAWFPARQGDGAGPHHGPGARGRAADHEVALAGCFCAAGPARRGHGWRHSRLATRSTCCSGTVPCWPRP